VKRLCFALILVGAISLPGRAQSDASVHAVPEAAADAIPKSATGNAAGISAAGSALALASVPALPSATDPLQAAAPTPAADPEAGAIADSGGETDSILAEADSAATAALAEAEAPESEEAKPVLWLETYGEGVYSRQEDDNLAGFSDWKVGKRLPGPLRADVYAKIRLYRDQRDFYWNNRADGGFGLRLPLLRKVSLTAFAEATWGHYLSLSSSQKPAERLQGLIESNRAAIARAQSQTQAIYSSVFTANVLQDRQTDRETLQKLDTLAGRLLDSLDGQLDKLETERDSLYDVMDAAALVPAGEVTEYKAGLVFWQGWGGPESEAAPGNPWFAFPFRSWGEIYADCIASSLGRHVRTRHGTIYADSTVHIRDIILYANPSLGWVVMDGKAGGLAAFASAYAWLDTRGDWWSNRAMGGLGLRYQPFRELDFAVKAEYLAGGYFGRERKEDPNPYRRTFTDTRLTASFWHGLGM
jgi:hypothetical protein